MDSMKPRLEALPIELVEHIVTFLELCDIVSLRLTSSTIESKASQGSFTAYFRHKNVKLTTESLKKFVRATSNGARPCRLLQHCTITGIARDKTSSTAAAAENEDTSLLHFLVTAFRNLKQRSSKGSVASLCLRVAARIQSSDGEEEELIEPHVFYSWRAIWNAAVRAFNITMAALKESQLPVNDHLDIFGGLKGCSLACDAFLAIAQKSTAMQNFKSLKKLTLSLSAPHKSARTRRLEEDVRSFGIEERNGYSTLILEGIMQLSHIMPRLESLDLHWYSLEGNGASIVPGQYVADKGSTQTYTNLKECNLRGVFAFENDLLRFLEVVHPISLTMTDIRLVSGTYASIFNYITSPGSPITYYHLDDIREGSRLVHFVDVPGVSKFPSLRNPVVPPHMRDNLGPSTLTRQASQVKEAICYRIPSGRALGSGARMRWVQSKREEFGSPESFRYDFIKLNAPKIVVACRESGDDS